MIAIDTSAMIAYLAGETGAEVEAVDAALAHKAAALPPPVLTELLSAPNLTDSIRETFVTLPALTILDGYWERAGLLRAQVAARGLKARLADVLLAQACIDNDTPLITRDPDFRHFSRYTGVRIVPADL